MAQRTVVLKLDRERGERLAQELRRRDFNFVPIDHARFSARGEGVVATLYDSGKLVVQGSETALFLERYLDQREANLPPSRTVAGRKRAGTIIGNDESGKGDFFGPLIVAGVRLKAEQAKELEHSGVADSKTLADATVLRLGAALRARYTHAIARLDPPEYNARHAEARNLNVILADLHVTVLRELSQPGAHALVDQFANPRLLERALGQSELVLEQRPRAEEDIAVAAASVIAREEFLMSLRRLSEEFAVELRKGAGPPADRAAAEFVALHGLDRLGEVAKLHFKNTSKLRRP